MTLVTRAGLRSGGVNVPGAVQPVQLGCPDIGSPARSLLRMPDHSLARIEEVLHLRRLPYLDAICQGKGEVEDAIGLDHPGIWGIDLGDGFVRHVVR